MGSAPLLCCLLMLFEISHGSQRSRERAEKTIHAFRNLRNPGFYNLPPLSHTPYSLGRHHIISYNIWQQFFVQLVQHGYLNDLRDFVRIYAPADDLPTILRAIDCMDEQVEMTDDEAEKCSTNIPEILAPVLYTIPYNLVVGPQSSIRAFDRGSHIDLECLFLTANGHFIRSAYFLARFLHQFITGADNMNLVERRRLLYAILFLHFTLNMQRSTILAHNPDAWEFVDYDRNGLHFILWLNLERAREEFYGLAPENNGQNANIIRLITHVKCEMEHRNLLKPAIVNGDEVVTGIVPSDLTIPGKKNVNKKGHRIRIPFFVLGQNAIDPSRKKIHREQTIAQNPNIPPSVILPLDNSGDDDKDFYAFLRTHPVVAESYEHIQISFPRESTHAASSCNEPKAGPSGLQTKKTPATTTTTTIKPTKADKGAGEGSSCNNCDDDELNQHFLFDSFQRLTIQEGEEARGGQEPDREWNILFKEARHFLLSSPFIVGPIVSGCIGNKNSEFYAHRHRYKRSSPSMQYQDVLLLAQKIHSQLHDEPFSSIVRQLADEKTLTTRTKHVLDAVCSKETETSTGGTVPKSTGDAAMRCLSDQCLMREQIHIILKKAGCHALNLATFGIGYFFNKC